MTSHPCYSIVDCSNYWFWAVWHDLGSCWFGDGIPFAYGRAKTRDLAIAAAQEALGHPGQITHERFAAQWQKILAERRHHAKAKASFNTNTLPNEAGAASTFPRYSAQSGRPHTNPVYAPQLQTLSLQWPFTQQQLLTAYRQKLRETHPDLGGTAEALIAVCEAYQLLKGLLDQQPLRSF